MLIWAIVLCGSALAGLLVAYLLPYRKFSFYLAGAIPWCLLLAALVYTVYLDPNNTDGNDGLWWIIVQLFAGTIAAGTGMIVWHFIHRHVLDSGR